MAYNFLGLVNDVNARLNEVKLTETNFASAGGFYNVAKEAVNASLRQISQMPHEWPFHHNTHTETLVANQVRYAKPADCKVLAMDTFRIKGDAAKSVQTKRLEVIDYEEYLHNYGDADFNPTNYASVPTLVFKTPDFNYGVFPPPISDYELVFEYYILHSDLENATDVPALPESFRHVIVDGAMVHCYDFRGDIESSAKVDVKYKEGIKILRSVYQNRYEYLTSTFIGG